MSAADFISAFETSDSHMLKFSLPALPASLHSLDSSVLQSLCKCFRLVKDYPRLLPFSLLQIEAVYLPLVKELERQERDVQIAIAETVATICEPEHCKSFPGSPAYRLIQDFLLKSHNEDASLPLLQTLNAYQRALTLPDLEFPLFRIIARLLRDCSYDPLVLEAFDLLLYLLGNTSECTLKAAYDAELIPILLIYIGNPSGEVKRRTMMALLAFRHAPYAVEPLATQGIGNLMNGLVAFTDVPLKKMTMDILTSIASSKPEYRDSLIVHNFAPISISLLTAQDPALKPDMLHLLFLIIRDHQKQHIDELVENNLITVLCRIAQREDGLRIGALECLEEILAAGGTDGMYKALMHECKITKLLLELRTSQAKDIAERILQAHFPKVYAAPMQRNTLFPTSGYTLAPGIFAQAAVIPPAPAAVPIANPIVPPIPCVQATIPNANRPKRKPQAAGIKAKAGKGKAALTPPAVQTARKTLTNRCGLVFPVPRIYGRLRNSGYRVSKSSAVFLTAIVEYLSAEVLELAGRQARNMRRVRIQPSDLRDAIRGDEELNDFTKAVVLPWSGVPPRTNPQ
jgi:histone H2A